MGCISNLHIQFSVRNKNVHFLKFQKRYRIPIRRTTDTDTDTEPQYVDLQIQIQNLNM